MSSSSSISPEKRLFLKERELSALLEITQAINLDSPETSLYKIFQFTLLGQLNIRRMVLYVKDEGVWSCVVSFGNGMPNFRRIPLDEKILDHRPLHTVPVADLDLGPDWSALQLLIPVLRHGETLAYVLIGSVHNEYEQDEAAKFLETLSNILLGAVENRRLGRQREAAAAMRKEIEIAQEVQTMLFPRSLPNNSSVAVHASYVPHTAIGGDYYDLVPIDDDRFLFCVADVSGKGVPASLLMSNFQAGLRTLLRQQADLATVVSELNNLIYRNAVSEKFITAFFGIYHRITRTLQYVSAGHNPAILFLDNDAHLLLSEGTTMLGIFDELPFLTVHTMQIPPRSLLLTYTDGLTEVFDPEMEEYGEEGVLRFLRRSRYLPLPLLHQELLQEVNAFNPEETHFADDITILSCRFK